MKVIQIIGKRERAVPILLNGEMLRSMEVLMANREKCSVTGQYFFEIPGLPDSRLHFYTVLQKIARDAQMSQPQLLTTTRIRKHHATMAQV